MVTRRCVARGRVQGVAFRYYVLRHAEELGVRGTVRNRPDGTIEAILQAEGPDAVEALIERIRKGPRGARVESIDVEPVHDATRYEEFDIVG